MREKKEIMSECRDKNLGKLGFDVILGEISDYAMSERGREGVLGIVPTGDIGVIREGLSLVKALLDFLYENDKLTFYRFINFGNVLREIEKGMFIEPASLYNIAFASNQYFNLKKCFNHEKYSKIAECFSIDSVGGFDFKRVLQDIKPDGYVEDSASGELGRIRRRIDSIRGKIDGELNSFFKRCRERGFTSDDIVSVKNGFSVVGIKPNYKNQVDGIVVDYSSTGKTVYIVPHSVIRINNELNSLFQEEQGEIKRIVESYCGRILDIIGNFYTIDHELIFFDLLYAKAYFSKVRGYSIPEVTEERFMRVFNGKHPMLGEDAVPLNVEIGREFNTLVITGPNTGGKTVVLKSLGIFSLMVQASIPVPVSSDSIFPVFDRVFADIGDEQSIEASLSTFSGHIKNIIEIENCVKSDSLVLIDEIGVGTDPVEGGALAIGIIKFLKKVGAITVVTTHYSSIKYFATNEEGIENGSMEFNKRTLLPTYRLLVGTPGTSHALDISQTLGIRDEILEEAKRNINSDYLRAEDIISTLEGEKHEVDMLKQRVKKQEERLTQKLNRAVDKQKQLGELEERIKEREKRVESDFLKYARREFENTIRRIKSENASRDSIRESKDFIKRLETDVTEKLKPAPSPEKEEKRGASDTPIRIGDTVENIKNKTKGRVVDISNKKNEYICQFGIMKLTCKREELRKIEDESSKEQENLSIKYKPVVRSTKLDIRGYRYEDAEVEIEKFIEDAALNNLKSVEIVHGKGTGALQKCIQATLSRSPFVQKFYYEQQGEYQTNYGVTIAELG